MVSTADAVVIGGGCMGASILFNLAVRGVKGPVLVERDVLTSGSTGRSSGAIRMHYSTEINARLAWESLKTFQNWGDVVGEGDPGFVNTGYLVFVGPGEVDAFKANIEMQQSVGIDTRIISADEAREICPYFTYDDCGGIAYEAQSGHGDPSGVTMAYAARARQLGAKVILENPATGIEIEGGRVVAVHTAQGRIDTPIAVVATGPWSGRFMRQLGYDLPLVATRHEVIFLKRPLDKVPFHPGGGDMANLIYFRPEGKDLTLIGNGNKYEDTDPDGYNQRAGWDFVMDVWGRMARRLPALEEAEFFTGYAGLYTNTPDDHPVMDRVEGVEGLYICTGFSGHGFKLTPAVGVCMAELILEGKAKTVDITPLRMSRFREGALNKPRYTFRVIV